MKKPNWPIVELGELVSSKSGGTPSRENLEFWSGDIPWFSGKDLKILYLKDSIEHVSAQAIGRGTRMCEPNTILVLVRGMTLMKEVPIGILSCRAAFNQDVKALVPRDESIDVRFVAYFLRADNSRLRNLVCTAGHGTGRLPLEALEEYPVPKPPLPEQRKIADILSTWDEALTQLDSLIKAQEHRKKALMQQLLTGKKRLAGATGVVKFVRASELFSNRAERNTDGLPILSVTQDQGVVLRSTLERRISHDEQTNGSYKVVRKGDFVISLRSFQGGLEYSEIDGAVSPAYHIIRPCQKLDLAFFKHYFKSADFVGRLATAVIGIRDGKQISFTDFGFIKLPFPPVEDQKRIGLLLDTADEQLTLLRTQRTALDQQKRGLMQRLLTGKLRVKP